MHITNENAHKTFIMTLAAGVHWLGDSIPHAKGAAVMSADMVAEAAQFAILGGIPSTMHVLTTTLDSSMLSSCWDREDTTSSRIPGGTRARRLHG